MSSPKVAVQYEERKKEVLLNHKMGLEELKNEMRSRFKIKKGEAFSLVAAYKNEPSFDILNDDDVRKIRDTQMLVIKAVPLQKEYDVVFKEKRKPLLLNRHTSLIDFRDEIRRSFEIREQFRLVADNENNEELEIQNEDDFRDLRTSSTFKVILVADPQANERQFVAGPENGEFVAVFRERRKTFSFNRHSIFDDIEEEIRTRFGIKERFHLVAYFENNGELDIQSDKDVETLVDTLRSSVPFLIRVYLGGPFSIWLKDVEHSITRIPPSNTYLMRLAREAVKPGFRKSEFVKDLHKLMHGIKLASYLFILTENRKLYYEFRDDLKPSIDQCTETFGSVVDKSKILLEHITVAITHLQDGLEAHVLCLLEEIDIQAKEMECESEQSLNDLKTVEEKVRTLHQKFKEILCDSPDDSHSQGIVRYLDGTLGAISKVQSVMSDMRQFWSHVKSAIAVVSKSTFMKDMRGCVEASTSTFSEEYRKARHMWKTMRFKLSGIAFISKHAAIRDICFDCQKPMQELQKNLNTFREEKIPDKDDAQRMYVEKSAEWETEPLDKDENDRGALLIDEIDTRVIDRDKGDPTVAAVREALGLPYKTLLEDLAGSFQETGDADLPLPVGAEGDDPGHDLASAMDKLTFYIRR